MIETGSCSWYVNGPDLHELRYLFPDLWVNTALTGGIDPMCLHPLANPFRGPVTHHVCPIEAEDGTLQELQRSASCI